MSTNVEPPMLAVGQCYLIESITSNLYVGRLLAISPLGDVILGEAAWVSETGRLHEFMARGRTDGMEIEPIGTRCIRYASWSPWPHPLFTEAE